MSHTVTAAMVQLRMANGSYVHVYQGAPLPADADPEHVKMLVADGMVDGEEQKPERAAADPAEVETPAGNAGHDEWAAFAVSQGVSQDEADSLSRNELRDRFK